MRHFGRDYAFGAKANGFVTDAGRLLLKNGESEPAALRHAFSFGVFLRATTALLAEKIQVRAQKKSPHRVRNEWGVFLFWGVDHCTCCVS